VFIKQLLTSFVKEPFVQDLNFDTLERVNASFVTKEYRKKEADMIWKINIRGEEAYIFLLMEFQSTVDKSMPLRFLQYILAVYQTVRRQTKSGKLPAVFPILFYNGSRKWSAPDRLEDMIEPEITSEFIPRFKYYTISERELSDETLLALDNSLAAIFYTENSSQDDLVDRFKEICAIIEKDEEAIRPFTEWFKLFFRTILEKGEREVPVIDIQDPKEAQVMLAAEMKKYRQELLEQGREEGKIADKMEMARKMLERDYSVKEISELTGLSVEEIGKLRGKGE
jgi:predicted transposase/invertase (TIGR01784 family)